MSADATRDGATRDGATGRRGDGATYDVGRGDVVTSAGAEDARAASGRRRGRPRRPVSVRGRLTAAATAAAGVVLVVAAVVVLAVVHLSLVSSLDDAAASSGAQVAALAGERRLPDPLPVTGAAVVQVLDARGRVLASSVGGDRLTALVPPDQVDRVRGGDAVDVGGSRLGGSQRYRVGGTPIGAGAGEASGGTVLVASSLADVDRSGAVLRRVALVGVPLAIAAVAALAWRTAGSALAPVEALRASAASLVARPTGPAGTGPLPVPTSGDEVARLAVTLNDALARVSAAGERQRAFVSDAAHELRSPLSSVRTQLEVAMAHPGASPWPEVAAGALADVERTATLVEDLLVLARLDEDPGSQLGTGRGAAGDGAAGEGAAGDGAAPRPVDLRALAREVVDASPWRVPVRVGGPGASAAVDARAVRRAVRNLVDNAARHAARAVSVTAFAEGDARAVLEVVDDGPGIPEAERSRVFERFTRLDDARDRDAGGSGLGLAIVRAAVERQGGSVAVHDAPGGGALLRVELPAAPDQRSSSTAQP